MQTTSTPHFVVGFLFNDNASGLALIKKLRPSWQKGLLNGIGGSIEIGETPEQAMERESREEIGTTPPCWTPFATLRGTKEEEFRVVHYFYAKSTLTLRDIRQTTDEEPVKIYLAQLDQQPTVPNVQWLVPMALSLSKDPTTVSFVINEKPQIPHDTPFDEPAQWRQEGTTFFLKHVINDCASVAYRPHEHPLVGKYLWTANVWFDCRIHTSTPIQGRAFSLAEAKHIVETLLVSTRTLEWQQLPIESDVQANR